MGIEALPLSTAFSCNSNNEQIKASSKREHKCLTFVKNPKKHEEIRISWTLSPSGLSE